MNYIELLAIVIITQTIVLGPILFFVQKRIFKLKKLNKLYSRDIEKHVKLEDILKRTESLFLANKIFKIDIGEDYVSFQDKINWASWGNYYYISLDKKNDSFKLYFRGALLKRSADKIHLNDNFYNLIEL